MRGAARGRVVRSGHGPGVKVAAGQDCMGRTVILAILLERDGRRSLRRHGRSIWMPD
jgi:hypothetical protein